MSPSVLRTEALSVSYGGLDALSAVDLDLEDAQLVGLIGPNGAGKTTLIDAVSGFVAYRGRVILDGRDLAGLPPERRAHRGLARTWQSVELFDDLTVRENLAVALGAPPLGRFVREILLGRRQIETRVDGTLRLLELERIADIMPERLTQGERKLVGVGRAVVANPRIVCLDEAAAGLDSGESEQLARRLRKIVREGTAMLLVDHDMGLVLNVCDHVVVLDFGRVIARGTPDQVRRDPRVIEAYLGSAAQEVVKSDGSREAPRDGESDPRG